MANIGQTGTFQELSGSWYFRYYDADGKRQRVRLGPASGPDKLSKPERLAKAQQILDGLAPVPTIDANTVEEIKTGLTVKMAGDSWLLQSQTRRRRPIRPSTVTIYKSLLERWIYPVVGGLPLADLKSKQATAVIDKMVEAGCATSVVDNAITVMQQIIVSITDADDEPIYPQKLNRDKMDAPVVKSKETKAFTAEQIEAMLEAAPARERVLFALLGGTGLRVGEALGIEISANRETTTTLSSDCRILYVQSILLQHGMKQAQPKSAAGVREVDIHPDLAALLVELVGDRTSGYLFRADTGKPLLQSNIHKDCLGKMQMGTKRKIMQRKRSKWVQVGEKVTPGVLGEKRGFHAFRRYRETFLRLEGVPQPIIDFWIGHGKKTISDLYTKVKQETAKRVNWCEKAGLGFKLPAKKVLEMAPVKQENAA
jgi:integrase